MATDNWNWDEIASEAGGQFLPMAQPGLYKVPVDTIDVRETNNAQGDRTYWLDILLQDSGDNSFPKISHPISFKNPKGAWRKWHYMNMFKELGISEDKAKQAVQTCESKSGNDNIVAAYHAMFERAAAKHPELEIEVYEGDTINQKTGRPYMRADFKNPTLAFGRTSSPASANANPLAGAEEVNVTQEGLEVPFF